MPFRWLRPNEIPWPRHEQQPMYKKMQEWAAWYSSDPIKLMKFYMEQIGEVYQTPRGRFWQKLEKEERLEKIHVPLAADIASMSADLLFSEKPNITVPDEDTQNRLDAIMDDNQTYSTLVEAAESASALGGTYLKINWDSKFKDFPILSVAQADTAIPEFKWGYLNAVTFHKVVKTDGARVYRLLEMHEPGRIQNRLYRGNDSKLGQRVSLQTLEETADLEEEIVTGIDDILVRYVPNKLPNRLWRSHNLGNSDLQGLEGLLDSLDETYSSMIREMRLAKAEKVIPSAWLEMDNQGNFRYDSDRAVYTTLDIPADQMEKPLLIQPDMRVDQYMDTCLHLIERIVTSAGFSPQSFGLNIEGRAESGTALRVRERKSLKTKAKKERYFKDPLEDILLLILKVDNEYFGHNNDVETKPTVEFADSIQDDPSEIADSLQKLEQAKAMSIEQRVRYLNQDWTEEQIKEETEKIMQEEGIMVNEPTDLV